MVVQVVAVPAADLLERPLDSTVICLSNVQRVNGKDYTEWPQAVYLILGGCYDQFPEKNEIEHKIERITL